MQSSFDHLLGPLITSNPHILNEVILNSMSTGLIVCEAPSGKIIFHNEAAQNILGHPLYKTNHHSEFVQYGGLHSNGAPYKPEEYPNGRAVLYGETVRDHDMLYRRGDGSITWLRVSAVPVHDRSGGVYLSVCSFHDISKEKGLEEELVSANEYLKSSNSELNRFASIAAHDLKAPLNTITSYLEILKSEMANDLSNTTKQYIDFITRSSHRARNLIDQLLNFARSGRNYVEFQPVNLNEIFDAATEILSVEISTSGALISRSDLPSVNGSESDLTRLFQNFISNSLKFRRAETPLITVSVTYEDHLPVFVFRDNGRGIKPENLPTIFEPFRRSASDAGIEGTGLGLAICSRIIELHGGHLKVESELGKGSVFRFTLTPPVTS